MPTQPPVGCHTKYEMAELPLNLGFRLSSEAGQSARHRHTNLVYSSYKRTDRREYACSYSQWDCNYVTSSDGAAKELPNIAQINLRRAHPVCKFYMKRIFSSWRCFVSMVKPASILNSSLIVYLHDGEEASMLFSRIRMSLSSEASHFIIYTISYIPCRIPALPPQASTLPRQHKVPHMYIWSDTWHCCTI